MQIICYGNPDRGDDGAAVLVAQRLHELGIAAHVLSGGALELIETWQQEDDVTLVDAIVSGAAVGTVRVWEGAPPLVAEDRAASSHGLGLAQALQLAEILHRLPRRLRVYGIEARRFEPGAAVSPEVSDAAEKVAAAIALIHAAF